MLHTTKNVKIIYESMILINSLMFNRIIFACLLLQSLFVFAKNDLEKTRQYFNTFQSVQYSATAFYPNPNTEQVTVFHTFNIINKYQKKNFEFYVKSDAFEEIYANGIYKKLDVEKKTVLQYENLANQKNTLENSRIILYNPAFLLKHQWEYVEKINVDGVLHSHYRWIAAKDVFEGKEILTEYHIYISPQYLISKFERKNFLDRNLNQTITYLFSGYRFLKNAARLPLFSAKEYSLQYIERIDISPLKPNIKTPEFSTKDITGKSFSQQDFLDKKTLLLFSNTNCGISEMISNIIYSKKFALPQNMQLINIFGTDSVEDVKLFFRNKTMKFSVIAQDQSMETKYQISGYPVLYLINEEGMITQTFEGFEAITDYFSTQKF